MTIKEIYELSKKQDKSIEGKEVTIKGLVRGNRFMGNVGFILLNDGSCFSSLQIVYSSTDKKAQAIRMGCSISVKGKIHLTPEAKQIVELESMKIDLISDVEEDYVLQKQRMSFEYLREIPQWRVRTNTFNALFRIRSTLSYYIHEYFHKNGYLWIHTPIITGNDCEGEGQVFDVLASGDKVGESKYFNSPNPHLTVSGQLHVEPFALAYQKVYTFGPTFRAEKSNTTRHAAEFWMIEPEIAFADLDTLCKIEEEFLKYVVKNTIQDCEDDINVFASFIDKNLKTKLNDFLTKSFEFVEYSDCINLLKKAQKEGVKFENNDIDFGLDLNSEHEKYLTEVVFKKPIFLRNMPKDIKAFYMKLNDDNKTVQAVDLLTPGIGELCGGSVREDNYDLLLKRIKELKMPLESYKWYLDLRKNGSMPHAGFGLGFERLVMLVTGIDNIRDTQPYPRNYRNMLF